MQKVGRFRIRNFALALGTGFVLVGAVIPLLYLVLILSGAETSYRSSSTFAAAFHSSFADQYNRNSLARSLIFAALASTFQFLAALSISRALFEARRFSVSVVILFIPLAMTPVATSLMWKSLFDFQFGPINGSLGHLGIPRIPWLSTLPVLSPAELGSFSEFNWGQLSIFIADTWLWIPFLVGGQLLCFSRVSRHLLESAKLEGATDKLAFRRIVFPLSLPYLLLLFFLRFVDCFRIFDTAWAFFGELGAASHFTTRVYSQAFFERDYLLSGALALTGVVLITPFVALLLKGARKLLLSVASAHGEI
jgi:multiple sugar transport system permease protein